MLLFLKFPHDTNLKSVPLRFQPTDIPPASGVTHTKSIHSFKRRLLIVDDYVGVFCKERPSVPSQTTIFKCFLTTF